MPLVDDLGELRQEHVELGAGVAGAGRVDQAGVAGRLAEPQQGFEDLDLRAVEVGLALAEQGLAVVGPQVLVDLPLGRLHVAVEGLLELVGQVLDDLRLGPAEDERPEGAGQQSARAVVGGPAPEVCRLKTPAVPSMPGLRNSKIDQSSPRWFSIGVPVIARRCRPFSSRAALADWLSAFLIAWASSRMT